MLRQVPSDVIFITFCPKRAEIAVAGLTVTERREEVVDFSVPFMHYTEDILMKKPSSSRPIDLLQFMHPFHYYVWLATLASLVVISVAVFVLNYFSPYGYKDDNGHGTSEEFSFFNSVWFALACMLQQGADNSPRSLSGAKAFSVELKKKKKIRRSVVDQSPSQPFLVSSRNAPSLKTAAKETSGRYEVVVHAKPQHIYI